MYHLTAGFKVFLPLVVLTTFSGLETRMPLVGGMCPEVGQNDWVEIADLEGIHQHLQHDSISSAESYTQFTMEADRRYRVVSGNDFQSGRASFKGDLTGTPSYVGFVPLDIPGTPSYFLGVLSSYRFNADELGVQYYGTQLSSRCQFMLLRKDPDGFLYSSIGANTSHESGWKDFNERVRLEGGKIELRDAQVFIRDGWRRPKVSSVKKMFEDVDALRAIAIDTKAMLSRHMAEDDATIKAKAHYRMGMTHFLNHETGKSIAEFEIGLRLNPGDLYGNVAMSAAYLTNQQYDKAMKFADQATLLNREFRDAYLVKGMAYEGSGNIEMASKEYSTAQRLNPHDGMAGYLLFLLAARTGRFLEEGYHGCGHAAVANPVYERCLEIVRPWAFILNDEAAKEEARRKAQEQSQASLKSFQEIFAGITVVLFGTAAIMAATGHEGSGNNQPYVSPTNSDPYCGTFLDLFIFPTGGC
jgi:tetratricopeptide (TPR) repeat protein